MNKRIAICAGGTGGHINAAISLGERFSEREFEVLYFSGTRYLDYQLFRPMKEKVFHLEARPLRSKDFIGTAQNLVFNLFCFLTTLSKFLVKRPDAVLGAGGYICGPTLMAAKALGIKTYIIEQNAVAGLTNRLLSKFSKKIFLNFEKTKGIENSSKVLVTGNPIRSSIRPSQNQLEGALKVLVFGGSLGAKQINEAVGLIVQQSWDFPIKIIHQVGKDNLFDVVAGEKVEYEQVEYIDNMEELYRWSNVIVARSGASTISELRVAKRPSILVPFPFATDDHQSVNAQELMRENSFYVKVADKDASPGELAKLLTESIREIKSKNLFLPYRESEVVDSCDLIYREVLNDVRNK